jgi:hypothetical protein
MTPLNPMQQLVVAQIAGDLMAVGKCSNVEYAVRTAREIVRAAFEEEKESETDGR